jgi:uncharacterized protein
MVEKQAKLMVQVHPNAGKNAIAGYAENVLHVKIAAPPVEGKANQELIEFFSELLDIRKSDITIDKGTSGRRKLVIISGRIKEEILAFLKIT